MSTIAAQHRAGFKYRHSAHGRARRLQWLMSNKGIESMRKGRHKYKQTAKGKKTERRYRQGIQDRATDNAKAMRRHARKREALLPNTADMLKLIYTRAKWWCAQGFAVEVDHIFPLGFGWHEPDNLQIIYKRENRIKGVNPDYSPQIIFI